MTFKLQNEQRAIPAWPGSLLLMIGMLIGLGLLTKQVPFEFLKSWHTHRAQWFLLAMIFIISGLRWLYLCRYVERDWQPATSGKRFQLAVLYTREGCLLCEEAEEMLSKYLPYIHSLETIDIDADPGLQSEFNNCVPVLAFDGKIRFRGKLNEVLLRRLISATPPISESAGLGESG